MPEPIGFRIVQNLQAALRNISIANGYHHDVASVAIKLDPDQDAQDLVGAAAVRPFILLEPLVDEFSYQPAMRTRVEMPVTIHAVHDSDVAVDDSWMQTYFRLAADVEQAIAGDITRGGLAVDTRILECDRSDLGGGLVWVMVRTRIVVIRGYGAPNG